MPAVWLAIVASHEMFTAYCLSTNYSTRNALKSVGDSKTMKVKFAQPQSRVT